MLQHAHADDAPIGIRGQEQKEEEKKKKVKEEEEAKKKAEEDARLEEERQVTCLNCVMRCIALQLCPG